MLKGLYAITDERLTPLYSILAQVEAVLEGGAKILQFRYKSEITQEVVQTARALRDLCHSYRALFIVNDHPDLALSLDADGIHVGKNDTKDLKALREAFRGKIVGVSCYGEIRRAIEAQNAGADYVAFGAFFPSRTKPDAVPIEADILKEAKRRIRLPLCAIGGITVENAPILLRNGADMLSVVGGLWRATDPKREARRFSALFTNPAPERAKRENSPERKPS